MEEVKVYSESKKEISEITFDSIIAGEITRKSIYIENIIKYPIDIEISIEGEDISITKNIKSIQPGIMESVEFEFTPKLTAMRPIAAKIKIKINYIVR